MTVDRTAKHKNSESLLRITIIRIPPSISFLCRFTEVQKIRVNLSCFLPQYVWSFAILCQEKTYIQKNIMIQNPNT
jgi:hypothetical protein